MRYFVHIGYHGTNYSGWQIHPGALSVQEVLQNALSKILKTPVAIFGCGRTDAQVHASQFFFHMDVEEEWKFDLLFRLNKLLPNDIAVFDIIPMDGLPHARFDAVQRSYNYFIHNYKDPFLSRFSSYYAYENLDLTKMREAVALLPLYNDYSCFCKSPNKNNHTICNIASAQLNINKHGDRLQFQISANRFLGKMVRIIVGRLLEIGNGKLSVDEFEHYLITKTTPAIIIPAHPQGLYLSKITYPYLDIPPRTYFTKILQDDINY
ncbi:MAG: tRNA pseudouridine(38-40) synthase TruA [Sphingobacteriaceae bacterium]|nr:MAG: tRNA pseudouridine(38-40) synthase TruA [Sphingobacteriaceae bacterium]